MPRATRTSRRAPAKRPAFGPLVRAKSAREWRAWLAKHHDTAKEAWLVLHKKGAKTPSVAYNDAVEAALCYGWIDSVVKPVKEGVRAQRYTPRRPGSSVSEMNRARVRRLVREGKMTPEGLAALPDLDEWLDPPPLVVAKDIERALRAADAWETFLGFPEAYRRIRVGFLEAARTRPDVFARRLAHLVKKTARGERFGMIQE